MKEMLNALKKESTRLFVIIVIALLTYYLTLYPVNKVGEVIDKLNNNQLTKIEYYIQVFRLVLAAFSLYIIFFFKEYFIFKGEFEAQYNIGELVLKKLYKQTSIFFNKVSKSDIISIIINDVTKYISFFFSIGFLFFVEGVIYNFVLTMVILSKSNIIFTLLIIFPFLIQTAFLVIKREKQSKDYKELTVSMDLMVKNTLENIKGIRIIRAYNMKNIIRKKFLQDIDRYSENLLKYLLNYAILQPLMLISKSFSYFILVFYGYYLVNIGVMSIGDLVSISIILAMLSWPYAALSELILRIREFKEASLRVSKILDVKDNEDIDNGLKLELKEGIEFKNFSFNIDNRKILDNISFFIPKGKTIGIVGKIGSGKTILIKQLLKFYEVEDSKIFIDSECINKYNVRSLRNNIGYVPQDNMLFSKSIKENILFYRNLEENLETVLYISDLNKDIKNLKNGIDSLVGENGISLSGGQRQRISIARGLLSNPEILILDDSLSAVDANTEKKVLERLKEYRKNKTNIIISHRISVVKDADEIIVLSNGEIEDKGRHEELILKDGWYNKLYTYQYFSGDNNEK